MDIDEIYHDLEGYFYLGSGQASTQSGAASSPLPRVRNRPNPKRSKLMRLVKTSPTDGSEPKGLKPSERAKLARMNSENGSAATDNAGLQVTTNHGVKPRGMNLSDMIDDGNSVNDEYENETEMVIDAVSSTTESKNKRGKRRSNGAQKTTPVDAADAIPLTGGMKPSERARILKQQTQENELFRDDMLDGLLDLPLVLNTLKTNTEAVNQDRTKVNKPIIHKHHNVSHATVRKSRPAAPERKYDFPDPKASIDSCVSSKNGGGRRRRSRSKHPPAAPP
ncbi:hypothetical protein BZA70DRAFT_118009 [Myxozyma melibiosi]|uniref:Uncharacterized protein n=1 Tax=Myxozyma melibiosi TaxID=54550 RepID=A0ABR1FCX4_9ASCO